MRALVAFSFVLWALWRFPFVLAPLGVTEPGIGVLAGCAVAGLAFGLTVARVIIYNGLVNADRRRAHERVDQDHDRRLA